MPKVPQVALLMEPEDTAPYEMLPGEGATWFHNFTHYRDLPVGRRSVAKAWEDHVRKCLHAEPGVLGHKLCPNRWRERGTAWSWQQRARDWDREVDRRTREALAAQQVEIRRRHQQLGEMSLAALSIPGRVVLQALQDPHVMPQLIEVARASPAGFMKVMDMVTWATKNMPGMVEVERISVGMPTESIEIGPKPEQTGSDIPQDAQATDLMIQLVSHMANQGLLPQSTPDTPPEPEAPADPAAEPEAGSTRVEGPVFAGEPDPEPEPSPGA